MKLEALDDRAAVWDVSGPESAISRELRELMNVWIGERALRNLSELSRQSGVPETSIRRAYNNGTIPQGENLLRLLICLIGAKNFAEMLERLPSSISAHVKERFPHIEPSGGVKVPTYHLDSLLADDTAFLVLTMVANRGGTTLSEIEKFFGASGIQRLQKLLEAMIVEPTPDGRVVLVADNLQTSKVLFSQHAAATLRAFYKADSEENIGCNISEKVSLPGFRELIQLARNYIRDARKILHDNPGEIPAVCVLMVDDMKIDTPSSQQRREK